MGEPVKQPFTDVNLSRAQKEISLSLPQGGHEGSGRGRGDAPFILPPGEDFSTLQRKGPAGDSLSSQGNLGEQEGIFLRKKSSPVCEKGLGLLSVGQNYQDRLLRSPANPAPGGAIEGEVKGRPGCPEISLP